MKGQQVTSLPLIEPSGQGLAEAQPAQCFFRPGCATCNEINHLLDAICFLPTMQSYP